MKRSRSHRNLRRSRKSRRRSRKTNRRIRGGGVVEKKVTTTYETANRSEQSTETNQTYFFGNTNLFEQGAETTSAGVRWRDELTYMILRLPDKEQDIYVRKDVEITMRYELPLQKDALVFVNIKDYTNTVPEMLYRGTIGGSTYNPRTRFTFYYIQLEKSNFMSS